MYAFSARYLSTCHLCDEGIIPGDPVVFDDGAVIHAECEQTALAAVTDPDCRAGKHASCVGGPCNCTCHERRAS